MPLPRSVLALAAALAPLACVRATTDGERPNVVVILIDDLGIGDVGAYNANSRIPTPHMDRLAAEGMRLDAAYAPSAVCSPSRYALLTGRYAWRTELAGGVVSRYDPLLIDAHTPTLAGVLHERGYATAFVGKWHLGFGQAQPGDFALPDPEQRPQRADYTKPLRPGPNERGFDHFFGAAGKPGMYFVVPPQREQDELASWFIEDGVVQVGDRAAWDQTQVGPILARHAVEWLEARADDEPFFLCFSLTAVHAPLHPAPLARGASEVGAYGDFVFEADWAVGQVLDALERSGHAQDTLVIVTSDNGPDPSVAEAGLRAGHRSNLDLRGWKRDAWEGGVRVPWIVRWPGRVPAGSSSDSLAALNDLFPTIANAAGAKLAHDAAPDGFDLAPALWQGAGSTPAREELVLHSSRGVFALRRERWKYVDAPGSGGNRYPGPPPEAPVQLYDLSADPGEARNLAGMEPAVAADMARRITEARRAGRTRP